MKKNSIDTAKYSRALRPFGTLVMLALALISGASVQAAILVTYDMQETGGAAITAPTNTHTDITASDLTVASTNTIQQFGKIQLSGDPADDFSAWRPLTWTGTNTAEAVYQGAYFSITITPDPGRSVTLSNLTFEAFAATAGPSARQIFVFSDKTGYSAGSELFAASTTNAVDPIPYNTASAAQGYSVDLSGNSAFSNINDSVTLRFYIQTPDIKQSLAFNDIIITGSTATNSDTSILLVKYDIEDYTNLDAPSFVYTNVTATDLAGDTNAIKRVGSLVRGGKIYATWAPQVGGGTNVFEAITNGTYLSMTVTPVEDKSVSISNLSFTVFAATAGPSARQVYVLSDKTGYTAGSELFTASTVAGSPLIPYDTGAGGQEFILDLSGNSAFANITSSVTFRFYVQTPNANQSLAFDEFSINGETGNALYEVGTITSEINGSDIVISWAGSAGPTYGVQTRSDLTSGDWSTIDSQAGINGLMLSTNATTGSEAFYRVILD